MEYSVEIVYSPELTDKYIELSEYLLLIGVDVQENYIGFSEKKDDFDQMAHPLQVIFLINKIEQLELAKQFEVPIKKFIICDENLYKDLLNEEPYNRDDIYSSDEDSIISLLVSLFFLSVNSQEILKQYLKGNLKIYLHIARLYQVYDFLIAESVDKVKEILVKMESVKNENEQDCDAYFFYAYAYLKYVLRKISLDLKIEDENICYSIKEIAELCDESFKRDSNLVNAMCLKGQLYRFDAGDYAFGDLYLKKYMGPYNYEYRYQMGLFWKNINTNYKLAEKYIKSALQINPIYIKGLYNYGTLLETQKKHAEAVPYYKKIIELLSEKKEKCWLRDEEFRVLCLAYKRIGCNQYKFIPNPEEENYISGLNYYKELYNIWENAEITSSEYINQCLSPFFPQEKTAKIAKTYQNSFRTVMVEVMRSFSKLHQKLGEEEKAEQYKQIYLERKINYYEVG